MGIVFFIQQSDFTWGNRWCCNDQKTTNQFLGSCGEIFIESTQKYRKSPEVHGLFSSERLWKPPPPLFKLVSQISPAKALFKMIFLFPRWYMLVPCKLDPTTRVRGFLSHVILVSNHGFFWHGVPRGFGDSPVHLPRGFNRVELERIQTLWHRRNWWSKGSFQKGY